MQNMQVEVSICTTLDCKLFFGAYKLNISEARKENIGTKVNISVNRDALKLFVFTR